MQNSEATKSKQIFELTDALLYANDIINTIREPLLVLYPKQIIKWANPSFYKTFKTTAEETVGRHIYDIGKREWDILQLRKLLDEILCERSSFYDFEVENDFGTIGHKVMVLNARKLTLKNKDDEMILLAIEDITERRSAEKKVETINQEFERNKHLYELSKQKADYFALASHELKTPVTSIKAFTQVLQMKFDAEGNTAAVFMLTKMNRQIDKLTRLITDLLDTTRMENGKMHYNMAGFDFNDLVNEVVNDIQPSTQTHSININLAETMKILGDRERIGQVITNLLSNAIKYSPGASNIIVRSISDAAHIVLDVEDFGIGISEENQDKVFRRFFRASGQAEDTFPGLGLGLFISAEIIKRHQGTINVKSVKGKGSTFTISLPVNKQSGQ
ncbi:MAG: PAS domain-containing sensor histidine kinase [Ginsengibacter sp.]